VTDRAVILREERYEHNAYHLRARLGEDGSLVIEGQDLGAVAEDFWGSPEYEWTITVAPAALPRLVTALGGSPGDDDPLDLLAARYRDDERCATRTFLEDAGVPFEFWNRVGD